MNLSIYRISLDVHDAHSSVCLDMKQEDTARQIAISLTDGGFPYQISEECYAVFAATKADGTKLLHHCSIERNTILYDVRKQTTAAVGLCECEIKLYGAGDKLLLSPGFSILVSENAVDGEDELVSEDEVDALTQLISEATTVITEGKEVNAEAEALIDDMEAKRTELEQQIADTRLHAKAAEGAAGTAKLHKNRAEQAAQLALDYSADAAASAHNAKASENAAKSSATTATNMANAAATDRENAEAAADRAVAAAERAEEVAENAGNGGGSGEKIYILAEGETVADAPADADIVIDPYGEAEGSGITEEIDPTVPAWAKEPTKPTYTAAEVGAAPKKLIVTITENDDGTVTASHSKSEIAHAVEEGRDVKAEYDGIMLDFFGIEEDGVAIFSEIEATDAVYQMIIFIDEDKSATRHVTEISTLPNPQKLTFKGAASGTYDGSQALCVYIPEATTDEHINELIDAKLGVIENGAY